jgi:hypothetical protein
VLPAGVLGEDVPSDRLAGPCLPQVEQRGVAVLVGRLAGSQVTHEQADVSQHTAVYPQQLALLPVPQATFGKQALGLALQLTGIG